MLRRSTTFPVAPSRLWEELTDPEALGAWFGYEVEWDLAPGGGASFTGGHEDARQGRIDQVVPGRHLRFSWWPEGDEGSASRVEYELEPDGDGTRLTVTEEPEPGASSGVARASLVGAGARPGPFRPVAGRGVRDGAAPPALALAA